MEKFGEVIGWIAAVCYFISVANLFVKRLYKAKISKLPQGSAFRAAYQALMRLLVRYHRYFGMAAGAFALFHLCWQITNVRVSVSGVLAAALMAAASLLGIAVAYGRKAGLVKVHRPAALALLAVVVFHMITKI